MGSSEHAYIINLPGEASACLGVTASYSVTLSGKSTPVAQLTQGLQPVTQMIENQ